MLTVSWSKDYTVRATERDQQRPPPHWRMKFGQDSIWRVRPLAYSAQKDHHTVNQKQQANEKPNWNDVVFLAHKLTRK
jgi:hypothetical protein